MVTLATERLVLRSFRRSDVTAFARLAGDWAVASMTSDIPHPLTEAQAMAWLRPGRGEVRFAIELDGKLMARSLARVASTVAEELDCKLVVCFTESGSTARLVSTFRPRAPIAAITYNEDTYRRLALWWGVLPVKSEFAQTTDEMIVRGEGLLKTQGLVSSGDRILMLAGQSHTAGATNMMRVHSIS